MAIQLQQAIDYSKANPTSQYAQQIGTAIKSGAFDQIAAQQGVDLSPFGRPKSTPQPEPTGTSPTEAKGIIPTAVEETGKTLASLPGQVSSDVQSAAQDIQKGDVLKGVAKAGIRTAGDVAGAIFSPISSTIGATLEKTGAQKGIDWLAQQIAEKSGITDIPAVQQFAMTHPNAAQDFGRIMGIIPAIGGEVRPAEMATEAVQAAKTAPEAIGKAVGAVKEAVTTTPEEQAAKTAAKLGGIADEWKKPTTVNSSSYNKARAVLSKDTNIPQFLSEQGINPFGHIENGKYATGDTAQALRDTAGQLSSDTLRPSLQAADASTPKTSVSELIQKAIGQAQKDKSLTAGDRETIIRNLNKEGEALQRQHPDGLGLTDMHDNKITYAQNAGYSPVKSAADNNTAIGNRFLASSFQKAVEDKAPTDLPVKDFNSYLSKYYRAADYLESLDTKKAPVSTAQYIAHRGAEVVGAAIGHGIGGGILGGVGGYMIGGALEHALENMTGKIRSQFLENIKVTNPEAFTKVEDYLKAKGLPPR